jgi:hypothetical protein
MRQGEGEKNRREKREEEGRWTICVKPSHFGSHSDTYMSVTAVC